MPDLKSFCGIILLLTLLTCPPLMAQTFTDASQLLHPMAPIEGGFQKGASAADFNNDGLVDIYHPNGNQVGRLYLNRGDAGFFDILPEIGLVEGARLWGAAFGDFDNGAYLDILFEDLSAPSRLYKNNRNWSFTQFNDRANVSIPSLAQGAGWGDFNLDGKLDLMVVNDAGANQLFKNLTFATFAEVTQSANVQTFGNSYGMSWGDLNNDGYLDLFVTNTSNQKNGLYHNNGDGTFTKITAGEIVNEEFSSMGCTWGDYDADGDLDLFVANASNQNNALYMNLGNGSFAKMTAGAIVNDESNSRGGSWGDFDNDGDLDLYVANFGDNALYANNGDGSFTKITTGALVQDNSDSRSSTWSDFDADGDLDLYVTNAGDNLLFLNNGDKTFTQVVSGDFVNDGSVSAGVSSGDFDADGDLDLFVANLSSSEKNLLFANNGQSNHWFAVKCVGTRANTSAIGTKVSVQSKIKGTAVWQMREISGQSGSRRKTAWSLPSVWPTPQKSIPLKLPGLREPFNICQRWPPTNCW